MTLDLIDAAVGGALIGILLLAFARGGWRSAFDALARRRTARKVRHIQQEDEAAADRHAGMSVEEAGDDLADRVNRRGQP